MRTCTDCGQTKALDAFTANKGTPWTHTRCKPCRAARARAGRPPREFKPCAPPGMRICSACGLLKPLDIFTPTNGTRYRKKTCKPCRAEAAKAAYVPQTLRRCMKCGVSKPITDFVRIRRTDLGIYRRCRMCRNARARERYHSSPEIRAAEIARASRNNQARKLRRRLEAAELAV